MDLQIRPITSEEFLDFGHVINAAFGDTMTDEEIEQERPLVEFDRTLATFDEGQIVATAGAVSFDLTLPGLTIAPAAGVTAVAVLPTHRRRGHLRRLMQRQLQDVRARGESLAVLGASESSIYGRFGYGAATDTLRFEVDRSHSAFAQPYEPSGRFRLLDRTQAAAVLPEVYDRMRRRRPGSLTRGEAYWTYYLRDAERWRDGASARFYVAYEPAPGQIDGFASYRVESKSDHDIAANILQVMEVNAVTPEARRALWHYCFNVDLVGTIRSYWSPVDEPLRWMLADPRRLRVLTLADFLWVRIVDVPSALCARRYAQSGRLVLEVADPFYPQNSGCYELEGGPEGATCRRSDKAPDLAFDVADLGAAFLGGRRFDTLAQAGRVVERSPGALGRADALFTGDPAPWCATMF